MFKKFKFSKSKNSNPMEHQPIKDRITELLNSYAQDPENNLQGKNLYILTSEHHHDAGDESSVQTSIWTSNIKPDNDNECNLDIKFINDLTHTEWDYAPDSNTSGLKLIWTATESLDWTTLQITDHSIYLITFHCGQY